MATHFCAISHVVYMPLLLSFMTNTADNDEIYYQSSNNYVSYSEIAFTCLAVSYEDA